MAERAKELGLEEAAHKILQNTETVILSQYVDKSKKDLSTVEYVQKSVTHLIAYIMATDRDVLSYLRNL